MDIFWCSGFWFKDFGVCCDKFAEFQGFLRSHKVKILQLVEIWGTWRGFVRFCRFFKMPKSRTNFSLLLANVLITQASTTSPRSLESRGDEKSWGKIFENSVNVFLCELLEEIWLLLTMVFHVNFLSDTTYFTRAEKNLQCFRFFRKIFFVSVRNQNAYLFHLPIVK